MLVAAVFLLPTLAKANRQNSWGGSFYCDPLRSPWLDLMLLAAVAGVVLVARNAKPSDVWYTTTWWHVLCLVLAVVAMFGWQRATGAQMLDSRGPGFDPKLLRSFAFALILGWVLALVPAILFAGPLWSRPINIAVLAGLFWTALYAQRVMQWAEGWTDDDRRMAASDRVQPAPAGG